ncbi:MAG TPA: DUF4276 family protein [Thermoanaerobaculia bacterium]|nr:DUF4276 family protein [Thermoanaerobaculia bacterium]
MTLHLEVLVEEPSAKAALNELLPRILPSTASFAVHAHQGKPALLRRLPQRLRAYSAMDWPQLRLLVLVDRDQEDCQGLKQRLEEIASAAGLTTKSTAAGGRFQAANRIAVEELEAWFFGDVEALRAAYPRVPKSLGARALCRDPDAIRGGTAEALARVLHRAGHLGTDYLPKITVASAVAGHLEPSRNRSHSFRCFCNGIEALMR